MFGALMGTLTSFQKSSSQSNRKTSQRAEIEARVKEKVQREKEELSAGKERLEGERKQLAIELVKKQNEEKVPLSLSLSPVD
jgi:hypothetical protein